MLNIKWIGIIGKNDIEKYQKDNKTSSILW